MRRALPKAKGMLRRNEHRHLKHVALAPRGDLTVYEEAINGMHEQKTFVRDLSYVTLLVVVVPVAVCNNT